MNVHNKEAERQLLVCILSKLEEHLPRAEQLGAIADWFYDTEPRSTFQSLHKLYAASLAVNVPLKMENLLVVCQQDGNLEYVKALAADAAFAKGLAVDPLAREVNGWYGKRRADGLVARFNKWSQNGASPATLIGELAALHDGIDDILQKRNVETGQPRDTDNEPVFPAFTTGCNLFDWFFHGGYRNGTTILMSAPTGMGKTSLTASLVARAVERAYGVVVFQLEIMPKPFQNAVLASLSGIPWDDLEAADEGKCDLTPEHAETKRQYLDLLQQTLRVYHKAATLKEIQERIVWARREWAGAPVVFFLDHLNLVKDEAKNQKGSGLALEDISDKLHEIATVKGLEVPIVINAQMDDAAGRKFKVKGDISDAEFKVRGSRGVELGMDFIVAFTRNPKEPDTTILKVIKDRRKGKIGRKGILRYDPTTIRFTDAPDLYRRA